MKFIYQFDSDYCHHDALLVKWISRRSTEAKFGVRSPGGVPDFMDDELKTTEEEMIGIKAIQYLQKMVEIDEPFEKDLIGCRSMSHEEKVKTLETFKFFYNRRN